MIQRIQSIYLFLAALVAAGLHFAIPVYSTAEGAPVYAVDHLELVALFFGSALLSLIALFSFKNRKFRQRNNKLTFKFILFKYFDHSRF